MTVGIERIYKYVFGPVSSRRLGVSLGVDLVPHKTCTLNCVYCECGKTTHLTIKRDSYVPVREVQEELAAFLSTNPKLDFITFSGSGEPTLNKEIGKVIRFLKTNFPQYKIALLTNGTLFYQPRTIKDILDVDLVKISIDAPTKEIFYKINRPHPKLDFATIMEGLVLLRKEFKNEMLAEIFIVPGINDTEAELRKIKQILSRISPDRIQLNSLDRPGTESWVKSVDKKYLTEITSYLYDAEVIDSSSLLQSNQAIVKDYYNRLLMTIKRRPVTPEDISQLTGIQLDKVRNYLETLIKDGKIEKKDMPRGIFYQIKNK
ncbi:MAG: radical SAM protein [Desulfosarcina sp.]|nr:radical SAM protein [Desulfobacterales bacterium]